MIAVVVDPALTKEIGDFGALVGLLLTLATLLTANRATSLADLRKAPDISKGQRSSELALNALLAGTTVLVWLAGLSLAVRAVSHLHPLADGGGLRSVFALTWILILGLVGWQVGLIRRVYALKASA